MPKIGIVGTRRMNDYKKFKELIEPVLTNIKIDAIISGAAKGIDSLAKHYANEMNINYIEFPPGNKSPLKRNTKIALNSDILIALPDAQSTGTYDTIRKAKKFNKQVIIIRV
jgi:predicted Rossmann fold nucleotide-binding protein DprA/Smf involved in DNA uptake